MKKKYYLAYFSFVIISSVFLFINDKKNIELQNQIELSSQELYKKIAQSQIKFQIVDIRTDSNKLYEEAHIPGSIPFPNCDFDQTNSLIKKYIFSYVPTIIVSQQGNKDEFKKCLLIFKNIQNLAGGFSHWQDSSLPEDVGEYTPPKSILSSSNGGGCL